MRKEHCCVTWALTKAVLVAATSLLDINYKSRLAQNHKGECNTEIHRIVGQRCRNQQ